MFQRPTAWYREKKNRTKERRKWLTVITRFRVPRIARSAETKSRPRDRIRGTCRLGTLSRLCFRTVYRKQTLSCGDNSGTASSSPFWCHRSSHPSFVFPQPAMFPSRSLNRRWEAALINVKLHPRAARFSSPESANGTTCPTSLTVPRVSRQMGDREQLRVTIVMRGSYRYCRDWWARTRLCRFNYS